MVDIVLLLFFMISIIYCCDFQAYKGFEFLVNDHESMMYGVGLSIIASYIFYVIQIYLPIIKNKLKYSEFIISKLDSIKGDMRLTITILTGKYIENIGEIRKHIAYEIKEKDIFSDGSGRYRNIDENINEEQVIVDALWENEWKIHRDILELISLNILGKKTLDVLMKIEMLPLRSKVEEYVKNKPSVHITVKEKKGQSIGGVFIYNKEVLDNDLIGIMNEYIDVLQELENFLNTLHGSGFKILISNMKL